MRMMKSNKKINLIYVEESYLYEIIFGQAVQHQ